MGMAVGHHCRVLLEYNYIRSSMTNQHKLNKFTTLERSMYCPSKILELFCLTSFRSYEPICCKTLFARLLNRQSQVFSRVCVTVHHDIWHMLQIPGFQVFTSSERSMFGLLNVAYVVHYWELFAPLFNRQLQLFSHGRR